MNSIIHVYSTCFMTVRFRVDIHDDFRRRDIVKIIFFERFFSAHGGNDPTRISDV